MTKSGYRRYKGWRLVVLAMGMFGLFGAGPLWAQEAALDDVQAAFATGDAEGLLDEAADRVEIALMGQSKLYSRAQATYVMEDFFRRFPPEQFTLQNSSQGAGNWFATGRYQYKHTEHPLHVYVRLQLKDEQWELREVRVEQRQRE